MNAHVRLAQRAVLPDIVLPTAVAHGAPSTPREPYALALWCASIGRTAADVAALVLEMPMTKPVRELFEAEIRQAVAAELLGRPASDGDYEHLEDVAWIAFARRLDEYGWPFKPKAISYAEPIDQPNQAPRSSVTTL